MKIIIIISISIPFLFAESHPIFMDGRFGDWYGIESAHVDSADDGDSLDFGTIHLANDDEFFFLKIEVGNEIIIQKSNLLLPRIEDQDVRSVFPAQQFQFLM